MDVNSIIENFKRTITEHYFDLNGRVGRREFWYFVLAAVVLGIGVSIIGSILHLSVLGSLVGLALLPPMTGMAVRRVQDTGRNALVVWIWAGLSVVMQLLAILVWLSPLGGLGFLLIFASLTTLIGLATLAAACVVIYFCAQPGMVGSNQFGADPDPTVTA